MALKVVVETLDDLDEATKALYKEQTIGGKPMFVLDVEGIEAHPTITNLKTAFERVKKDKKELGDKVTAFEERFEGVPDEFNAEAYEALKAQAEGKEPQKTDEAVAGVRAQLEKKHQTEIQKKDERINVLTSALQNSLVDDRLTAALVENNVAKEYLPAVRALIKSKGVAKLHEEEGKFGAVVETDVGPSDISQFVKDWASSEEGKSFIKAPAGGGAGGGRGADLKDNPWDNSNGKKPNLTKQQELIQANPEKARQFAQAAGQTPNW